ncbi:hypothetical protein [Mangrovimonas yunxiaonensis]|nr:hypothetical protein [Mangrovimonas yunxiaonensis]
MKPNHVILWHVVKKAIPFSVIHSDTTKNVIKILKTLSGFPTF